TAKPSVKRGSVPININPNPIIIPPIQLPGDVLNGGDGRDVIYGGAADNTIGGGAGDDIIYGGDGHNFVHGGDGNDNVYGGPGDDVLVSIGGGDNDTCVGGDGLDQIWADPADQLPDANLIEILAGTIHRVDTFYGGVSKELNGQHLTDPNDGVNRGDGTYFY